MIITKIMNQIKQIKALYIHPKAYTALIRTNKALYYYDLVALTQIWYLNIFAIEHQGNDIDKIKIVFTLNFNEVFIFNKPFIIKLNWSGQKQKVQISKIRFLTQDTAADCKLFSIIQNHYLCFIDKNMAIRRSQENNRITLFQLKQDYRCIEIINYDNNEKELVLVGNLANYIECFSFKLVKLVKIKNNGRLQFQNIITFYKIDQKHHKIGLLFQAKNYIAVVDYRHRFQIVAKYQYESIIQDFLFFSYAENTDTVNSKYKNQFLLTIEQIKNDSYKIVLRNLIKQDDREQFIVNQNISQVYFNRLFDNSFLSLSRAGQLYLVNLFGYSKQWINLGLKFVHIESNELYFEKQNDFEIDSSNKNINIKEQDLDDYSYSIFTEFQLGETKSKFKRIEFQI